MRPKTWRWFEPYLTYDNARLPQALIAAGARLDDAELLDCGLDRPWTGISISAAATVSCG